MFCCHTTVLSNIKQPERMQHEYISIHPHVLIYFTLYLKMIDFIYSILPINIPVSFRLSTCHKCIFY